MNSYNYNHNLHLESVDLFKNNDPHLFRLKTQAHVFTSALISRLPHEPGIYTLSGGRQIGKTTLIKQWMLSLMEQKAEQKVNPQIDPQLIRFFTGEVIDDHHQLIRELNAVLDEMPANKTHTIIIDEVNYIANWDKGIKYLADANRLSNTVLLLTGSDLLMLQEARMRFPGRRGMHAAPDFHYYPLSFRETVELKSKKTASSLSNSDLLLHFDHYLIHGGFLTAMNDFTKNGKISEATYLTYSDWIRGDMLKKGKQEHYLRAIIQGILKRYGSLITWNSLSKELPIDHHATISEYIELLCRMDVTTIMESLLEDKLMGAPKKGRKVFFQDPFILAALSHWTADDFSISNPEQKGVLIEGVVAAHFKRLYPTYVLNSGGEVDIAYVKEKKFFPIEVKWTGQIRSKDLKQIKKYKNGLVWSKEESLNSSPPTLFLPGELLKIGLESN